MNTSTTSKNTRRRFTIPSWLFEDWVWEGLLVVLIAPVVVHSVLSIGGGGIV